MTEAKLVIKIMKKKLLSLWEEVLHQDDIGEHENAAHLHQIAKESEKIMVLVSSYVDKYQNTTKREILALLKDIGEGVYDKDMKDKD